MSSRVGSAGEKAPGSSCGTPLSISPASWGPGVSLRASGGSGLSNQDGLERETAPEYAAAARAIALSSRQRRIGVREMILAAKLRSRPPQAIGALPLTVLSAASRSLSWWPVWAQMQDEIAGLSTDAVHITALKAGHYVHLDEPELVVQAIRDLVERCRQGA